MSTEGRWKTEPPGSETADQMREMLRQRLEELEGGDIERVHGALREEVWLAEIDPEGVPDDVLRETREILGEAATAISRDQDATAARDAIQRALVIW